MCHRQLVPDIFTLQRRDKSRNNRISMYSNSEAEFKEIHGVWDPTLKLIITSPYLRVYSE
jgi:hypothetical protein